MLRHEEKCKNSKCKEKGWNKLKVVDVEYLGDTDDEVNKLENAIDPYKDNSSVLPDLNFRGKKKKKCQIM